MEIKDVDFATADIQLVGDASNVQTLSAEERLNRYNEQHPEDKFDLKSLMSLGSADMSQPENIKPTLTEMIGGAGEPIKSGPYTFYPKSPKIKQQKQFARMGKEIQDNINPDDVDLSAFDYMVSMAQILLYQDENCTKPATPDQIEDAFDMDELTNIIQRLTGVKVSEDITGK